MTLRIPFLVLFVVILACPVFGQLEYKIDRRDDVAQVWSGHPVGFCLQSHKGKQFVGFYDANRNLVIGVRDRDSSDWTFKPLDTQVGWDSHNSITMTFDRDDILHVSGNMHCVPLLYFRAEKPLDVQSLRQVKTMVGENEQRCTYPQFITAGDGELLFLYRDGGSGDGDWYCNRYDATQKRWHRFFDKPLFDGEGQVNAYHHGPVKGPDGWFHLSWVWRETPDCETNHLMCYARSKNLRDWEMSDGTPQPIPITRTNSQIIDPVPSGGGILNPCQKIGFDAEGRVIVSYSKYDEAGHFQLMNARVEGKQFKIYQTSNWDYRWEFQGRGCIPMEISFGPVVSEANGDLTQSYNHIKSGNGRWRLDPETLKPIGQAPPPTRMPDEVYRNESRFPGHQRRSITDSGTIDEPDVIDMMCWETLPVNRDRPWEGAVPPPTTLRIFRLSPK
ncbi:MAG: BNR repeat-containing protein [Planctomycetaceae bacterium]|nr:BNR repeat-containing protein [Planctomycetaceae bacterium]